MKLKIIALGIALALAAAPGYSRAAGMAGGAEHGGGFAHDGATAPMHNGQGDHMRGGHHDHRFGPSFGGDFGDPFFDSYGYQPEYAEPDVAAPEDPHGVSPPAPSVEPAQNACPVAAHADHAHHGPQERVGQVVVMRGGCADEIVTVPAG